MELEERVRPIGRFLGRQEGRGGYIALEIEKEITEGEMGHLYPGHTIILK